MSTCLTRLRRRGKTIEEPVKHPLRSLCALALICLNGAQAQITDPLSADVSAFLTSPTHCAVLIGGVDRAADGADRIYGEALHAALTGLRMPLPSAIEWMRTACVSRSTPTERLRSGAS